MKLDDTVRQSWLDQDKLWHLCGETVDLFYEVLRVYLHSVAPLGRQLAGTLQRQAWPKLARQLHSLKGSLQYLAREPLCQQVTALEQAALRRDSQQWLRRWPSLQASLAALEQEIGDLLAEPPQPLAALD